MVGWKRWCEEDLEKSTCMCVEENLSTFGLMNEAFMNT